MANSVSLMRRRDRLVRQINDNLDFLVGSVSTKGLNWPAYNLTMKVDGLTKSRHIPKDLLPLVRRMTGRHKKLKRLLAQLGDVNWQLVRAGVALRNYGTT